MTDSQSETTEEVVLLKATIERLQRENDRLQEKARHADSASKAKSDFLAMISHEIRTPMNGVIGLTELMLRAELAPRQKHFAELILASARNLLTLINSLLDFSKIEANKMVLDQNSFDLLAQLREIIELYRLSGREKNLSVFARIDPQLHTSYIGDSYRIRQILLNLLGNAVKFTEKGEVQLNVKVIEREHNKDVLRFEVKDTGVGIVREKQGQLFQPFTQLDGPSSLRHSGTGLGLSICAKLVELMNGSVGLTSTPGQGSTFWFQVCLPVASTAQKPLRASAQKMHENAKAEQKDSSPSLPYRILIVDDEPTNRVVLRETLHKVGVELVEAVNGQEAVDLCMETNFDLIFMDCQMPVMDGFESTIEILSGKDRAGEQPVSVVALTADATPATRQRCRAAGMVDYLLKPLDFDELQKVIGRFFPVLGARIQGSHVISVEEEAGAKKKTMVVNPSAIENLRRNIGDITPVIRVFLQALENRLKEVDEAVKKKDAEAVASAAHTIKGSSSQFGAEELAGLCQYMENMGRENSLAQAESLLLEIQRAVKRLHEVLIKELD